MTVDTLLHNGIVLTLDEQFTIIENGAIAIKNGAIDSVWSPSIDEPLPEAKQRIDLDGGIVMPGLINAHTHLPMSLFRGLADDLPLHKWLEEHIFPAEAKHIDPGFVHAGAQLACAEMVLGGTTTCCDGYFLVAHYFDVMNQCGMRAVLGQGVIDFPAPGVPDPTMNVDKAKTFVERHLTAAARLTPSIFCHSPYTCSAHTLTLAKQVASEFGVLFQIHVAETRTEADQIQAQHGCSSIQYLNQLGILDSNTLLVHAVWINDIDIDIIADSGAGVVHCPESNMKLASGVAPIPDCLNAGINVGLGTDGCASNNNLNLWSEMDSAAKLHKVIRLDPTTMDAQTVLRMATNHGARALGLAHLIGSLEPGKRADLIVIDNHNPHWMPMYHPASHLVYVAEAADVRHVMIDGNWVVRERQLLTLDIESVLDTAYRFKQAIQSN